TSDRASMAIEVAVRRTSLPPFPGAVNIPGRQSDTSINTAGFDIDGRDYGCSSNCDTAANWNTTSNPMKYGMATQTGTQTNNSTAFETNVESALNTSLQHSAFKRQTKSTTPYTTARNT